MQCKSQNHFIFQKAMNTHLLGNSPVPLLLLWLFHISSQEFLCKKIQLRHLSSVIAFMKVTTDTDKDKVSFQVTKLMACYTVSLICHLSCVKKLVYLKWIGKRVAYLF